MLINTRKCNISRHPEFSFSFDPAKVVKEDADWLRYFLEEIVAKGHRFKSGETVQIGWMINLLKDQPDHSLGIYEPDFESSPIVWEYSATKTLHHLRLQKDVVSSVGLADNLDFPSIRQSGILGTDVTRMDQRLILERIEEQGGDSGWFIGDAGSKVDYNDPTNLRRTSLYEIALLIPKAIMFLALPSGCRIVEKETSIDISYFGNPLTIQPGSLLDCLQTHS